jgi:SH3 domain protein
MNSLRKSILALGLFLALGVSVQAQSSKAGYVNATNVNMRSYHSTQSKVVGKLQKGETVLVLNQASTNSNTVEAILLKDAKFYSQDGEYRFTLPKGKAVELLAFDPEEDVYHVAYVNAGVKGFTKLDRTSVKTITYEQWYYIQTTKTKKRAWVLARYIDLAEDVDEDSIVVYEE